MKINSAISQAVLGIQRGIQSAQKHAGQIASADQFTNNSPTSMAEPLVGLTQDRLQVSASTSVLKTMDEMIGSLFNEQT